MVQSTHSVVFRVEKDVMLFCSQDESEPAYVSQGPFTVYDVSPRDGTESGLRAQVGEVFWSLGSNAFCVRVDRTTFSFSVPESPGLYVTTVLPADTDPDTLEQLLAVLGAATTLQERAGAEQTQGAFPKDSIEYKAEKVARTAGWMLRGAASAASFGLHKGAEFMTQRLAPTENPVRVSDRTLQRLQSAKTTAGHVATFTGRVASEVAKGTTYVAGVAARRFNESGWSDSLSKKGIDVSGVSRGLAAGVAALTEVFEALESAGLQVLQSLKEATTKVVHHRYGTDAAAATELGMGTAVSIVEARRHLTMLGPRALAKATAKAAAKQAITTEAAAATAAANLAASRATAALGGSGAGVSGQYDRMSVTATGAAHSTGSGASKQTMAAGTATAVCGTSGGVTRRASAGVTYNSNPGATPNALGNGNTGATPTATHTFNSYTGPVPTATAAPVGYQGAAGAGTARLQQQAAGAGQVGPSMAPAPALMAAGPGYAGQAQYAAQNIVQAGPMAAGPMYGGQAQYGAQNGMQQGAGYEGMGMAHGAPLHPAVQYPPHRGRLYPELPSH